MSGDDDEPAIPRRFHLEGTMGSPTPIGQGRSDAQIAAEYRERALEVLGKLMDLINEARAEHGMNIIFQINGPDGFNRQSLALLEISKKLC